MNGRIQEKKRLEEDFFARDGLLVARELLGKILVHDTGAGRIRGIITEVESYMGVNDKGSHTYGGRRTERTEPMFHKGGTSYVYFTYGMYHCMNIATGQVGDPQAVLIRSVVPADEESGRRMLELRMKPVISQAERKFAGKSDCEEMKQYIQKRKKALEKNLSNGPGKLCIAMGITRAENDVDMTQSPVFFVTEGIEILPEEIQTGKRIGIDYAEEAAEYPWRFFVQQTGAGDRYQ